MAKAKKEVEQLLENSLILQKVLLGMTEKLDKLTKQISSLLELFERAATKFEEGEKAEVSGVSKSLPIEREELTQLIEKLEKLEEQNKIIANALTLLEEKMRKEKGQLF